MNYESKFRKQMRSFKKARYFVPILFRVLYYVQFSNIQIKEINMEFVYAAHGILMQHLLHKLQKDVNEENISSVVKALVLT